MPENHRIAQIRLPSEECLDPHPYLILDGNEIHAGTALVALFPDGWFPICIEMNEVKDGVHCWYISTPGFGDISPIGLFVQLD